MVIFDLKLVPKSRYTPLFEEVFCFDGNVSEVVQEVKKLAGDQCDQSVELMVVQSGLKDFFFLYLIKLIVISFEYVLHVVLPTPVTLLSTECEW